MFWTPVTEQLRGPQGRVLSPVLSRPARSWQSLHVASSPGLSPLVDLGCGTECPWPVFPWPLTHTKKTLPLRALWRHCVPAWAPGLGGRRDPWSGPRRLAPCPAAWTQWQRRGQRWVGIPSTPPGGPWGNSGCRLTCPRLPWRERGAGGQGVQVMPPRACRAQLTGTLGTAWARTRLPPGIWVAGLSGAHRLLHQTRLHASPSSFGRALQPARAALSDCL